MGNEVGAQPVRTEEPLVSIGLPVRNGGEYLSESIQSILDQTYHNIELVICDNLSTDDTQQVCEAFASRDPRVKYHRNETDIGGSGNHNLVYRKSVGEYFRWSAHDDVVEPELIERCVEILETHPDVVLCHTDFVQIDEHGDVIESVSRDNASTGRPSQRFAALAFGRDYLEEIYGVMRSEVLAATRLHQDYTASDRTLMSEIALRGRFHNVEETLFRKRLHPGNEYLDWRARMVWFGDKYRGKIVLPWWRQLFDYVATIRRVPLPLSERVRCSVVLVGWTLRHSLKLGKDVALALLALGRSRSSRRDHESERQNWA